MMSFQYHEHQSFMHSIDPISKIIWLICISLCTFIFTSPLPQLILLITVFLTGIVLTKLNIIYLVKSIWIMVLIGIGFFILQVIFVPGSTLIFKLGPLPIYTESVEFATAITIRILVIFSSSLIFVISTDPRDIVISLTRRLKIPYRYSYSLFIALRFIPTLEEEAETIRNAQAIRGVGIQKGLKNKIINFQKFSMPLLMGSIRRVRTIANTMDAKGYGAFHDRTYIRNVPINVNSIVFVILWLMITAFLVFVRINYNF